MTKDFGRLSAEETLRLLETSYLGLEEIEVKNRLSDFGPNSIDSARLVNWPATIRQFLIDSPTLLLMLITAIFLILSGDQLAAALLLIVLLVNGLVAARAIFQNMRARESLKDLRSLIGAKTIVRRSNRELEVNAAQIVPGDILLLEQGDRIPADGRIVAGTLVVSEKDLTGRQTPVRKNPATLRGGDDREIGERTNIVYMGTEVYGGRGEVAVTATGQRTKLGQVISLLQSKPSIGKASGTRLIRQLNRLIVVVAFILIVTIVVYGRLQQMPADLLLAIIAAISVASVPEALPSLVVLCLQHGAELLRRRYMELHRLETSEVLGEVTVICIDKPAFLQSDRLDVTTIDVVGDSYSYTDKPDRPAEDGLISQSGAPAPVMDGGGQLSKITAAMTLMSFPAHLVKVEEENFVSYGGDMVDQAYLAAAQKLGITREIWEAELPRLMNVSFENHTGTKGSVHEVTGPKAGELFPGTRYLLIVSGHPETVLEWSYCVLGPDGELLPLSQDLWERARSASELIESDLKQVTALAIGPWESIPYEDDWHEQTPLELQFLGFIGLNERLYTPARTALQVAREAGIRTVLLAIDSPNKARGLAEQIGMIHDWVITGAEIDQISDEQLRQIVQEVEIYANVSPANKHRIVEALQSNGDVVVVTGQGMADVPAVMEADVGVALGRPDENIAAVVAELSIHYAYQAFYNVVSMMEQGRTVYENIRKIVAYLLSGNLAELLTILAGLLIGMPLTLLPLQVLWLNLITSGLPAIPYARWAMERDAMQYPPYLATESIFSRGLGRRILAIGLSMGALSLSLGFIYWQQDQDGVWQTVLFSSLAFSQILLGLTLRNLRTPLFRTGLLYHPAAIVSVLIAFVTQLAVIYVPFLQGVFSTKALEPRDLAISLLPGLLLLLVLEALKWAKQ